MHSTSPTAAMPAAKDSLRIERQVRTLRELALERLRDAILNLQFRPGERLVERTLCERLGVSRTVVREVLRHLETEGLVDTLPQGPAVAKPDASQAAEIYEIRALLEAQAARAAAETATDADIVALKAANEAIQLAFATGTSRDVLRETTAFYEVLFTVAGKQVAWQVVKSLNMRINHLRGMTVSHPGRASHARQEMERIITAIAAHDGDAAAKASFDHIATVQGLAAAALRSSPERQLEAKRSA